jgi:hypothetical protein
MSANDPATYPLRTVLAAEGSQILDEHIGSNIDIQTRSQSPAKAKLINYDSRGVSYQDPVTGSLRWSPYESIEYIEFN